MYRMLVLGAVAVTLGGVGVTRLADLEERLARLDRAAEDSPRRVRELLGELERVEGELAQVREDLARSGNADRSREGTWREELERIDGRIADLHASFADDLAVQGTTLDALTHLANSYSPEVVEAKLQEVQAGALDRISGLETGVQDALLAATRAEEQALAAGQPEERDLDAMWDELVGPAVQLAGNTTVGSGVLLQSRETHPGEYETLVVTAWHVVRDILAEPGQDRRGVPVTMYSREGEPRHETAELLHHDVMLDAALLRLNTHRPQLFGARLAPRTRLSDLRIFAHIYAVGCPLGNDPIPTSGEIADLAHEVDGNEYWMISAPTYIGNSGGGIYDAETHQLLGIFSKIYTHGSLRPTVVPHMGLVTPISQVYDWLESEGVASLSAANDERGSVVASYLESGD